jgi:hypothetical protein
MRHNDKQLDSPRDTTPYQDTVTRPRTNSRIKNLPGRSLRKIEKPQEPIGIDDQHKRVGARVLKCQRPMGSWSSVAILGLRSAQKQSFAALDPMSNKHYPIHC